MKRIFLKSLRALTLVSIGLISALVVAGARSDDTIDEPMGLDRRSVQIPNSTVQKPTRDETYKIQTGDRLHITVEDRPDLDQELLVLPDGNLMFHLIKEIQVSGLTLAEIETEIATRIESTKFVSKPKVTAKLLK